MYDDYKRRNLIFSIFDYQFVSPFIYRTRYLKIVRPWCRFFFYYYYCDCVLFSTLRTTVGRQRGIGSPFAITLYYIHRNKRIDILLSLFIHPRHAVKDFDINLYYTSVHAYRDRRE